MKLSDAINALESIAPTRYAESWDNVGLLVGDPRQDVSSAMLTIDYTPEVADEARTAGCDLIVAYHPPLFSPIKKISGTGGSAAIFDAIRRGVAIYSPHTALDVAPGGTNDMLADAVGMTDCTPLKLIEAKSTQCKLVTFVPAEHLERVSSALFAAGAGRIGNYSRCSFQLHGTGTFFGEDAADPAVGQKGTFERVEEIRLETVVPLAAIEAVVRALKQSHPYEEPAFDLNTLAAAPEGLGIGRVGKVSGASRGEVIERIKRELGIEQLLVAGKTEGAVNRAAVCAGACGDLLDQGMAQKVDLYLTGEMRHHDALKAANAGITVVCTLHSNSERAVLKRLADRLGKALPALPVRVSQQDRDPFSIQ
jgi:dinuclear metal center YbgI/SA1388 family protein